MKEPLGGASETLPGGDNMGWVVRTGTGGIDVGGEIDLSGASSAGLCK